MSTNDIAEQQMEEPLVELERELISAYVAGTGHSIETLRSRSDNRAKQILTDASIYATARLSEVESRLRYLRSLRGET